MAEEKNLNTTYNPAEVESRLYEQWKEKGYFKGPHITNENEKSEKGYFSIVMPPPNVTGFLHLGHAMDETMQDILTRFKRMRGYDTLWLPGTDHAGIATQAKVEEKLRKEGISKNDLGREKFVDEVWNWKHQYHDRIANQLGTLGCSCDWERERFTLDEGCSEAVKEVFCSLYEKGLIYQGSYLVNWCPHCHTTISDIEVDHSDEASHLWHIKYPFKDIPGKYMTVATTRPETMLGDVAVAVNPNDERYKDLIGKMLILPLVNKEIPVIADEMVDLEFGTGCVKITPAHDPNDFETGIRHHLEQITVIDKDGKITYPGSKYDGMDRYDARKAMVEDLQALGLMEKIEDHTHAVGHCYRCGTTIEPLISKQWFVKMEPLAKAAIEIVKDGRMRFVPGRFSKIYLNWMENVRDWCISRQLWWGHRIPVWYCDDCGEVICSRETPHKCPKCGSVHLTQDPDVLDTWFSSALWPFSTMGWPENTDDLKNYYPTSTLVTGRDIIFFWVARMAVMGMEFMKDVPFKDVLIHGLVLDAQGRKMSKSLGNGIDPIEVINEYGADTLRFTLMTGNTPGNDLRFQKERLEGNRNFCNKIWNATRFALMNLTDYDPKAAKSEPELSDKWILSRYNRLCIEITALLEDYDMGEAATRIYSFLWDELCDWYIEVIKTRLYGKKTAKSRARAQETLLTTLRGTLTLLHPFMPYITEELWQAMPHDGETIMLTKWQDGNPDLLDDNAEKSFNLVMDVVKAARNLRSEVNAAPGKKSGLILHSASSDIRDTLILAKDYIESLGTCENLVVEDINAIKPNQAVTAAVSDVEVYLPLAGIVDVEKETARINKEITKLMGECTGIEKKLSNEGFLAKAPAEVIEKEKAKLEDAKFKISALKARMEAFKA